MTPESSGNIKEDKEIDKTAESGAETLKPEKKKSRIFSKKKTKSGKVEVAPILPESSAAESKVSYVFTTGKVSDTPAEMKLDSKKPTFTQEQKTEETAGTSRILTAQDKTEQVRLASLMRDKAEKISASPSLTAQDKAEQGSANLSLTAQDILTKSEKEIKDLEKSESKREANNLAKSLRIITAILLGKKKNKELSQALQTDKSFTSKQVKELEEQGLVKREGEGKDVSYEVDTWNVLKFLQSKVVIKWKKEEREREEKRDKAESKDSASIPKGDKEKDEGDKNE